MHSNLPKGAIVERVSPGGDDWVVYRDASGSERFRLRSAKAKTLNEARPGRNRTDNANAGINPEGDVFVYEGKHRSIGNSQRDAVRTERGGVVEQPGVLDFPFEPNPVPEIGVPVKDLPKPDSQNEGRQ